MKAKESSNESRQEKALNGYTESTRQRAYELYLKRGQKPGHDLDDWLEAERESKIRDDLFSHEGQAHAGEVEANKPLGKVPFIPEAKNGRKTKAAK